MNVLVILASALFAFTASAGEYSVATVEFQSASAFYHVDEVCRDGNVLKHKTKTVASVQYCDESDSGSTIGCKTVAKPLEQPVVSTSYKCVKYSDSSEKTCVKTKAFKLNQASVPVWTYGSAKDMEDGRNGTVTGKVKVEACPTAPGKAL